MSDSVAEPAYYAGRAKAEFVTLSECSYKYFNYIEIIRDVPFDPEVVPLFMITMSCRDTGGSFEKYIITDGRGMWQYATGFVGNKIIVDIARLDHDGERTIARKAIDQLLLDCCLLKHSRD